MQERGHGEAFGRARNQGLPRVQAPPAVPSFGGPLPLPAKPPAPHSASKRPRKKKRKHNQLGLTPKAEEHESSEEEDDDADEESRLAPKVSGVGQLQQLQINYRGRTSTLGSLADIAAWIEERKKNFPTKARAAEAADRKRQRDEAQKAASKAQKERRDKQNTEAKEKKKKLKADAENERKQAKEAREAKEEPEDAATKAKRKIEKLRRQLEKEEKRIAKAEAQMARADDAIKLEKHVEEDPLAQGVKRKRSTSPETLIKADQIDALDETNTVAIKRSALHDAPDSTTTAPDPLTPTSQPRPPDESDDMSPPGIDLAGAAVTLPAASAVTQDYTLMSDFSSEISSPDSEDMTSSSGSSDSSADSDDAPEETISKRDKPERVPPPKREKPKQLCKSFMEHGRCRFGDSCRFRHELPDRGSQAAKAAAKANEAKKPKGRKERVSLHQRVSPLPFYLKQ